jgi:hypothetical protein
MEQPSTAMTLPPLKLAKDSLWINRIVFTVDIKKRMRCPHISQEYYHNSMGYDRISIKVIQTRRRNEFLHIHPRQIGIERILTFTEPSGTMKFARLEGMHLNYRHFLECSQTLRGKDYATNYSPNWTTPCIER